MAPYTYSNYYDPVGSQNNSQQNGYTYQSPNSSQYPSHSSSNYQANYDQNYGNTYANQQQYSTNTQQVTSSAATNVTHATSRTASSLTSLHNPGYSQNSTSSRSQAGIGASSYDPNSYYTSPSFAAMNDRNQSNNSSLYQDNTGTSTFGRLSLPDQSQSSSVTFGNTPTHSDHIANNQAQPPQRYASPLHAVQAQQQQQQSRGHSKQVSRSSNAQPSPQMTAQNLQQRQNQRRPSANVDPSPTTVDPAQVYDFRAEQQRKAQAEAEKRKRREAERVARQAEEDARRQAEERKVAEEAARKEEQERIEKERKKAGEKAAKAEEDAAKKKAAQARKNEQRRKARDEKQQSQTAATALTQMASGSAASASNAMSNASIAGMPGVGDTSQPPANAVEAEMRAMFKKMRELNALNPDMLSKLWEEERQNHAAQAGGPVQPAPQPPQVAAPKRHQHQQHAKAGSSQPNASNQTGRPPKPATAFNAPAQSIPTPVQNAPTLTASTTQSATTQTAGAQVSQPSGSGALWPPHKKGALAEAATKWLNDLPRNLTAGRSIVKDEVLNILDTNPSYVQLCESLEKKTIYFERSALAQELLKAVPDQLRSQAGKKAGSTPNALSTQAAGSPIIGDTQKRKGGRPRKDGPLSYSTTSSSQRSGPVQYEAPVFSLANAAREVNSMSTAPTLGPVSSLASAIESSQEPQEQSPFFTGHQPLPDDDSLPGSHPEEIKAEEQPAEPPRPPADKEEAARKRTFNDLVDLTKDNDSDDEGPPRKLQQPVAGPHNGAVKYPQQNDFNQPMMFQQFVNRAHPSQTHQAPYQHTPYAVPGPHVLPSHGNRPPVPPVQTMPPGQVVPPKPKQYGPTEEQKQHERMRGKMLVEPIMRDRVARKSTYDPRTIARDVLLATGRHPDMRPLNAHLHTMQKLLGDHGGVVDGTGNKSDLSTIRWDIIDPGEPAEEAKKKAKTAAEHRVKTTLLLNGEEDGDEAKAPAQSQAKADAESEADDEGDGFPLRAEEELRRSEPKKPRGRPGRPPKIRPNAGSDAPPSLHTHSNKSHATHAKSSSSTKGNQERDDSPAMSTGATPVGYAAFRKYDENGNEIKKKGRPVGWRKSIHSRQAHGLAPAQPGTNPKSTGSRLRQSTGPQPKENTVQPQYAVYDCKWKDCNAQLDNLERLRKHVVKLHGGKTEDDRFACHWLPCKLRGIHVDEHGEERANDEAFASFDTVERWMKHVDGKHIESVAKKLGDGPRGGSVSEINLDSDSYLSDAHGRSVTPIILEPSLSNPSTGAKSGRTGKFAFLSESGPLTKEQREAAEELQKLRDRKLAEGIFMGREGSRLANAKRRRGFLDDEEFEDVVYESG